MSFEQKLKLLKFNLIICSFEQRKEKNNQHESLLLRILHFI